jgi:protein subunit release factor B
MKEEKQKRLLFSITKEDCEWQYFRSGGKGGQNQNKVNSGVRCIHHPSGARGEARDSRDQLKNRQSAFQRMVSSRQFISWHKLETARRVMDCRSIEEMVNKAVNESMNPANFKIEIRGTNGKWIEVPIAELAT